MFVDIIEGLSVAEISGRLLIMIIFSMFFPLTAISYFRYMVPKKEIEYKSAIEEMGIISNRTISDTHSVVRFLLPVGVAFLICFFAISYIIFADKLITGMEESVVLTGPFFGKIDNSGLVRQSISVLSFAFIGGFIWSATNIIRRLIAFDLSPSVYYSAGIRILMASIIALVLSFLIGEESAAISVTAKSSLAAISFLTGMFPERVLNYLVKLFQKFVNPNNLISDHLSLYRIQGISLQHKERLEEIGIDNAQNLASSSLTKLLIETPFKSRLLLDWIGQAKLLCYTNEETDKLRSVGIRSVFDLLDPTKKPPFLEKVAEELKISPILLQNIHNQVKADKGINFLYGYLNGVNTPGASPTT